MYPYIIEKGKTLVRAFEIKSDGPEPHGPEPHGIGHDTRQDVIGFGWTADARR